MLPSLECMHSIAPAAAMVDEFEWNTQNTNKTQLLTRNYELFGRISYPKTNPLLNSSMQQVLCKCETPRLELESSATFLAIKRWQRTKFGKVFKLARSLLKNGRISTPILEKNAQGRSPLRQHWFIKSTPLEGRAASPPWWSCLLRDLCFLIGFWLVTRQLYLSYVHFRGVTKWATQACTIPNTSYMLSIAVGAISWMGL